LKQHACPPVRALLRPVRKGRQCVDVCASARFVAQARKLVATAWRSVVGAGAGAAKLGFKPTLLWQAAALSGGWSTRCQ